MKTTNREKCLFVIVFLGIFSTLTAANIVDIKDPSAVAVVADSHVTTPETQIVEILPEDFKPAFTRDTVIKLNSIVEQSYAVIREFDNFKKDNVPGALDERKLATLNELTDRSKSALQQMNAAVVKLKSSKEHYNPAVLAGMLRFVETVEDEISHSLGNESSAD